MSPEKQRITIAKACGWTRVGEPYTAIDGSTVQIWRDPQEDNDLYELPDYLNDLNAMHEAEKIIPAIKLARYTSEIWAAMCRHGNAEECEIGILHATAAQRAEAFLRTLNLWEEE